MSKKAPPIPQGYHTITPFLMVKDAQQAIQFYGAAFGAKELEKHLSPDGKIVHALLQIGDSFFMLADEFPDFGGNMVSPATLKGSTASLHLYVEDADAWFQRAVQAGGTVKMPLADTFWGDRYGQVEDPFGHTWSIATHQVDLSPEEIAKKGQEFMQEQ